MTTTESWRQFLGRVAPTYQVFDGMPWGQYALLEETFGMPVHKELRGLLEETNGTCDESGFYLVWSIERMISENSRIRLDQRLRKQYMPLDCLFFFGDAGNGDLFGHAVVAGEIACSDIFCWSHEDDSRTVVATNLRRFIEGWLDGSIEI